MEEIRVDCPAKINLFLEVLGKRDDGYHEVVTVMQTIELHDRLFFRAKESGINIRCNDNSIPADESNLIYKAAQLLLDETGSRCGVSVELDKRIPAASGLGGASSDAAGTFIALNRLWDLKLTKADLLRLSRKVGTDVSFFVYLAEDDFSAISGGTLLGEGRGDELTRIPSLPPGRLVLAAPPIAVSTKWAYSSPHLGLTGGKKNPKMIMDAIESGNLESACEFLFNRFEEVIIPKYPVVGELKRTLLNEDAAGTLMSGSGPVVFGLFPEASKVDEIAGRISGLRKEEKVYVTGTYGGNFGFGSAECKFRG